MSGTVSLNNMIFETVSMIRKNVGEISSTEGTIDKMIGETIMQMKA